MEVACLYDRHTINFIFYIEMLKKKTITNITFFLQGILIIAKNRLLPLKKLSRTLSPFPCRYLKSLEKVYHDFIF